MIVFTQKGDFKNLESWLNRAKNLRIHAILNKYGARGVAALAGSTPVESGITKSSWDYRVKVGPMSSQIYWTNSHVVNGVPIAVILHYGHGTGTGGYVEGRNYINPEMRPIFDQITKELWEEVTRL